MFGKSRPTRRATTRPERASGHSQQYSGDKRLITRIAYTYAADGLLKSWTILDEQGNPLAKTDMSYGYDAKGNCVKSSQNDETGQSWAGTNVPMMTTATRRLHLSDQRRESDSRYEYQYDTRKRLTQETFYNKLGKVASVKHYTYDKQGDWRKNPQTQTRGEKGTLKSSIGTPHQDRGPIFLKPGF